MGRSARRGAKDETFNRKAWSVEEDTMLSSYIQSHGEGQWAAVPLRTGLQRSGKSCRLRWFNYLRPDIKLGNISADEKETIIRLHSLVGNRWSLIARQLPGRTDNEIKNYWNTRLKKEANSSHRIQSPPQGNKPCDLSTAADQSLIEKPSTHTSNSIKEAPLDEISSAIASNDCGSSADDETYSNVETAMAGVAHDYENYYYSEVMLSPVIHRDEVGFTLNPVIAHEANEWSHSSAEASNMNGVDYILPLFSDDYTTVQEEYSLFLFN